MAMLDKNINRKMLAEGIGRVPEYLSAVIWQRVKSPNTEKLISDYLNIPDDGKDDYD